GIARERPRVPDGEVPGTPRPRRQDVQWREEDVAVAGGQHAAVRQTVGEGNQRRAGDDERVDPASHSHQGVSAASITGSPSAATATTSSPSTSDQWLKNDCLLSRSKTPRTKAPPSANPVSLRGSRQIASAMAAST